MVQPFSVIKNSALTAAVLVAIILLSGCAQDKDSTESPVPATNLSPPPIQMTLTIPSEGPSDDGPAQFIPGGVYPVGEEILIAGTTILSPGNPLLIEIQSVAFGPTNKSDPTYYSGATAVIGVEKGSPDGQNTWRYLLNTSGFVPGDYSLEITGLKVQGFRESRSFTLIP
jgi:hypothetical protein